MLNQTTAMTNRPCVEAGIPSRSQVESVAIKPRGFDLDTVITHRTPVDPAPRRP